MADDAFPTLTAADLAVVESFGTRTTMDVGDVLFHSGDTSYSFFAIVSGAVAIINDTDGVDEVVTEHGPGRFLGELNLLTGQRVYLTARVSARGRWTSPSRCAAAVARRSDRHLRAGECLGQQRLHVRSLDRLASGTEAFVESVQRPDVAGVLDGTRQRVVESEIGAVDRLRLAMTSLVQQQRSECVTGWLHPTPRLVVHEFVRGDDCVAQMVEPFVDSSRLVGEFALGHVSGDHQHALGRIVEHVAGLLDCRAKQGGTGRVSASASAIRPRLASATVRA